MFNVSEQKCSLTGSPRAPAPVCPPPAALSQHLRLTAAGRSLQTESPDPSSACSCGTTQHSTLHTPQCVLQPLTNVG